MNFVLVHFVSRRAAVRCSLFRVFGGDRIKGLMSVFQIEDLPIESKMLTDALTEAQRKVESYFFGEPHSVLLSACTISPQDMLFGDF